MSSINDWRSVEPPWAALLVLKKNERYETLLTPPSEFVMREIHGRRCKTKPALLSEFARALDFPSYFGTNWDALEDCLIDLEWLPAKGYLLVITNADQVLPGHYEEYRTFLNILRHVGKEWATPQAGERPRPAISFHVVFIVTQAQKTKRSHWDLPILQRER